MPILAGYQGPPGYLLQAAGPPGAQAHPTSTVAARASTASTKTNLFNMPVVTIEVRRTHFCIYCDCVWLSWVWWCTWGPDFTFSILATWWHHWLREISRELQRIPASHFANLNHSAESSPALYSNRVIINAIKRRRQKFSQHGRSHL